MPIINCKHYKFDEKFELDICHSLHASSWCPFGGCRTKQQFDPENDLVAREKCKFYKKQEEPVQQTWDTILDLVKIELAGLEYRLSNLENKR